MIHPFKPKQHEDDQGNDASLNEPILERVSLKLFVIQTDRCLVYRTRQLA